MILLGFCFCTLPSDLVFLAANVFQNRLKEVFYVRDEKFLFFIFISNVPIIIGKGHVGIVAIIMMITRVMTSFTVCLVIPTTTTKLIKEVRLFKMQPCMFSTCGHEFNFIVNVNVRSNQQIWWAGFICSPAETQTEYK